MKKEQRYCDVCGDERGGNTWEFSVAVSGTTSKLEIVADLCPKDRLRVLEAAVAQMREAQEVPV